MKFTTIALVFTLCITTITAQAEGSTHHSGQASKHSVLAVSHGAVSTAKVASAAVAVPLMVAGSVALTAGAASVKTGTSIGDLASRPAHHGPLVITETTITADPAPNKVLVIHNKHTLIQNH
ncbi:hypothetical protein [uncultured Paraglaciecola sp.]|jgi:hypothetical protein|uniref:hypothetical protein n=1 Tax=uncultured Paraglaciecola sp. TaxID=1765024 RepID=UPI0030DD0F7B|tara:strand:+ start:12576 stop:12941 length:366 start_codon:yes stop_codon:yes gene_type:complete